VRAGASPDLIDWLVPRDERIVDAADGVEIIEAASI
jgi:hypothetical protein